MKPYLKNVEIVDRKYAEFSYQRCAGLIMLRCPRCKIVNSLWFEMRRSTDDSKDYDEIKQPCYCQYCGKKLVKEK